MHEPLVEALPGILGAASAVGGLSGIVAIAGASLRRKKHTTEANEVPTEETSDDDLSSATPLS